jgi:hypothetical protein
LLAKLCAVGRKPVECVPDRLETLMAASQSDALLESVK